MAAASAQRATLANVQEKHTVRAERKKYTTAIGTLQEQQHNFPSRMKSGTLEGLFFVSRQQSLRFSRHSRAASLPLSVDRAAHSYVIQTSFSFSEHVHKGSSNIGFRHVLQPKEMLIAYRL